jgi:hypothetical protein
MELSISDLRLGAASLSLVLKTEWTEGFQQPAKACIGAKNTHLGNLGKYCTLEAL